MRNKSNFLVIAAVITVVCLCFSNSASAAHPNLLAWWPFDSNCSNAVGPELAGTPSNAYVTITNEVNEFKVGGIVSGEFIDSDSAGIGPVQLRPEWQKYEIDLRGADLSYIIGGFCWATNIDVNDPEGIVFYLDEIKYETE